MAAMQMLHRVLQSSGEDSTETEDVEMENEYAEGLESCPTGDGPIFGALVIAMVAPCILYNLMCRWTHKKHAGWIVSYLSAWPCLAVLTIMAGSLGMWVNAVLDGCGNIRRLSVDTDFGTYVESDHPTSVDLTTLTAATEQHVAQTCVASKSRSNSGRRRLDAPPSYSAVDKALGLVPPAPLSEAEEASDAAALLEAAHSHPPPLPADDADVDYAVGGAHHRRLGGASMSSSTVNLFYVTKDLDTGVTGNVLEKGVLEEILEIEQGMIDLPRFTELCYPESSTSSAIRANPRTCRVPHTVSRHFFAPGDGYDEDSPEYVPTGAFLKPYAVLREMLETGKGAGQVDIYAQYRLDGPPLDSGYPDAASNTTKAKFAYYGVRADIDDYVMNTVKTYLDEKNAELNFVRVVYENTLLNMQAIDAAVINDCTYSLGAVCFIAALLLWHTGSLILAVLGLLSVTLSFGVAYYLYVVWFGVSSMLLMNFLALFIILGVGADDIFLFTDHFRISTLEDPEGTRAARLQDAFGKASSAMLVTSVTSAASYFANCVSALPALRAFGVYMGCCIVSNYINVCTFYCAALAIQDRCCHAGIFTLCCKKRKSHDDHDETHGTNIPGIEAEGGGGGEHDAPEGGEKGDIMAGSPGHQFVNEKKMKGERITMAQGWGVVDIFIHDVYTPLLFRLRHVVVYGTILLTMHSMMRAMSMFAVEKGQPKFFSLDHNLGMAMMVDKDYYGDGSMEGLLFQPVTNCLGECSDRGACLLSDDTCLCEPGWYGDMCERNSGPTGVPTVSPTSAAPTTPPTFAPTRTPTVSSMPTQVPVPAPTTAAYVAPTASPTTIEDMNPLPTFNPTQVPIPAPTFVPTVSSMPTQVPVPAPTPAPSTMAPTGAPSPAPGDPTPAPSYSPVPTMAPCSDDAGCSGRGSCTQGRCVCYGNYGGMFCEELLEPAVPTKQAIPVDVFWGIAGREVLGSPGLLGGSIMPTYGEVELHPGFDLSAPETQVFLFNACVKMLDGRQGLGVRGGDSRCVMLEFMAWLDEEDPGLTLPLPSDVFAERMQEFVSDNAPSYDTYVGYDCYDSDETPTWIRNKMVIDVSTMSTPDELIPVYERWAAFNEQLIADAPATAGPSRMTSASFSMLQTQLLVASSTSEAVAISFMFSFVALFVFTQNATISALAVLTVLMIVVSLLCWMVVGLGYEFGAIEALSVIIFVGYSVDYTLHIAHTYVAAHYRSRYLRVRASLTECGGSLIASAITTGGAAMFLCACVIQVFVKMGYFVLACTGFSLFYALVFFPALLLISGPRGRLRYADGRGGHEDEDGETALNVAPVLLVMPAQALAPVSGNLSQGNFAVPDWLRKANQSQPTGRSVAIANARKMRAQMQTMPAAANPDSGDAAGLVAQFHTRQEKLAREMSQQGHMAKDGLKARLAARKAGHI